ncbi:MAG: OmpA family protein [Flavobacteriales bacterium]|nr:OmpA family protein [Flavobacteriales bacterium]MCB9364503.1 OmpA family protein [Flavobacteriales bacterium]
MNAQHADCNNLLELKDTIYIAKNIKGFGLKKEFSGNDLENKLGFEEEANSIWYLIKIPADGKFTFEIIAQDNDDDWDFLLYEHLNLFCKRIDSNKITPIRSNLSRSATTGLSLTSSQEYSGAGLNDNFSKYINVKGGEEYVLVVNNPKNANGTHKLILHLPQKEIIIKKEAEVVVQKPDPNLKKFKLEIKNKSTKQVLSANVSITGLKKETIELQDLTEYETEIVKQNYEVNVIAYAEGFMLSSFDYKLSKTRSVENEIIYLDKIEEGKKVNLKTIQFYGERADFLPTAEGALSALLSFMQTNSTIKIEIEGHVNGPDQSNTSAFKKLSFARALAVKQYLVENGIEGDRIQYVGYGNSQMLYPYPKKEEEHSANRRVEVKIIKK